MLELDHIAVAGETLEEAAAHVEQALGQPMLPGGVHARFATHNRLLGLAPGLYLEAIAIDPAAPPPPTPRWFGLDHFAGPARLDKWICRVPDLDAAIAALPEAGVRVELERGPLRWAMAVPEDGNLPFDGLFPALIQWHSDLLPGRTLPGSGLEMKRLTLRHPEAKALAARLEPFLAAPLVHFETADAPSMQAEVSVGGQDRILA